MVIENQKEEKVSSGWHSTAHSFSGCIKGGNIEGRKLRLEKGNGIDVRKIQSFVEIVAEGA